MKVANGELVISLLNVVLKKMIKGKRDSHSKIYYSIDGIDNANSAFGSIAILIAVVCIITLADWA